MPVDARTHSYPHIIAMILLRIFNPLNISLQEGQRNMPQQQEVAPATEDKERIKRRLFCFEPVLNRLLIIKADQLITSGLNAEGIERL